MNKETGLSDRTFLLQRIKDLVLLDHTQEGVPPNVNQRSGELPSWSFDFRLGFSHRDFLEAVSRLFWQEFDRDQPWQIGGLESASLPLITAFTLTGNQATSFYIRKSRKKKSMLKQVEGDVMADRDIVLVDDLINSGSSFLKQIKVLEAEAGLTVKAIFVIVRFRDMEAYKQITDLGITIHSLFTLDEFNLHVNTGNIYRTKNSDLVWRFTAENPHFFAQGAKNIPILHQGKIFYTSDNGNVWCLDEHTGEIIWQRRIVFKPRIQEKTFGSSCIIDDTLYVTTYQGILLALRLDSGLPLFKLPIGNRFTTALMAHKNRLIAGVTEGAGRGVFSLVRIDPTHQTVVSLLHPNQPIVGSILVDEKRGLLVCADSSNTVYCLRLTGGLVWSHRFAGRNAAGVGSNDYGDVLVINGDGDTVVVHIETGETLDTFKLPQFHAAPPTCQNHKLYGATLGREIYCYDYRTHEFIWEDESNGRMYSAPIVHDTYIAVGDNNGRAYIRNRATGEKLAVTVVPDRITNPLLLTPRHILISTFADELHMLKNAPDAVLSKAHEQNHPTTDHDPKH